MDKRKSSLSLDLFIPKQPEESVSTCVGQPLNLSPSASLNLLNLAATTYPKKDAFSGTPALAPQSLAQIQGALRAGSQCSPAPHCEGPLDLLRVSAALAYSRFFRLFQYILRSLLWISGYTALCGIPFGKLQLLHAEETVFASDWETWTSAQIEEDFSKFSKGITLKMIETNMSRGHPYVIRYRIFDGEIYQRPYHPIEDGRGGMAAVRALEKLLKKYPVPDVDFLFYEHDPPPFEGRKRFDIYPGPIFIGSKSKLDDNLIVYHDNGSMCYIEDIHKAPYNLNPSYPPHIDAWDYDWPTISNTMLHAEYPPWENKKNALFWIGRLSDGWQKASKNILTSPRENLVLLSMQNPELINARFYNYRDPNSHWSISEHCEYKYQIALDGVTSTFPGYLWRLFSTCVVFKQTSPDYLWFERQLKPWVHYVPVAEDMSDLLEKLLWAMTHDKESSEIATNSRRFVLENAMPEHILKYCYKALVKYASLQHFKVGKPSQKEMVLVSDPLTKEEKEKRRRLLGEQLGAKEINL